MINTYFKVLEFKIIISIFKKKKYLKQTFANLIPFGIPIHELLISSYLATTTETIPIAFKPQLN